MTVKPLHRLVGQFRRTLDAHHADDSDLLARYRDANDPSALEALVRKHGALVLSACRAVLSNDADVEDAFQAAFVLLIRSARSIRNGQSLPIWLYRVARRVALQARNRRQRCD